jgi:HJR/Mrr/RecB family endonuclease
LPIQEVIEDLSLIISLAIEPYADRLEASSECELDEIDDPQEYERAVSNEFSKLGWQTRVTAGSGDQGADVIAEKFAVKLVIQCKLYESPVGNKAVQEVAAAVKFFNGDIGVVITNHTFTKSARQLASSLGIFLVHHTQIPELDRVIFDDDMDLEDPIDEH